MERWLRPLFTFYEEPARSCLRPTTHIISNGEPRKWDSKSSKLRQLKGGSFWRGKLSRIQFFRVFRTVGELAGLPVEKRHPHVLKHSLASHLVAGNANLALVRQALGHRSINSTMAYIGTSDAQAAEALQKALMGLF